MQLKHETPSQSWRKLEPAVKRAKSAASILMLLETESATLRRAYILNRLISAYLTRKRMELRKAHLH